MFPGQDPVGHSLGHQLCKNSLDMMQRVLLVPKNSENGHCASVNSMIYIDRFEVVPEKQSQLVSTVFESLSILMRLDYNTVTSYSRDIFGISLLVMRNFWTLIARCSHLSLPVRSLPAD